MLIDAVLKPHASAVGVLARAFAAHGHQLYLVGGPVRDALLRLATNDLDFTTEARPAEIKRALAEAGTHSPFDVGEKFGTIGAFYGDVKLEITTFRSEQYSPYSRKPSVEFGHSLEGDLSRRDFTINAIAIDVLTDRVIDPFGGQLDLAASIIRAVGVPRERFDEDPLRLLRAIRFAARLGFGIEPETAGAMAASAAELAWIPRERVRPELTAMLVSPRASWAVEQLCALGLMPHLIPELIELRGMRQERFHHKDVYHHTLQVVEHCAPDAILRWAALLHDIGKPRTRSVEDGEVHFHRHEIVGRQMARRLLRDLTFSKDEVDRISLLVEQHLRPNAYESDWTDGAVRRLMREAGDELDRLLQLSRADVTSQRADRRAAAARRVDELERRVEEIRAVEDVARIKSPLDGNDLMALFGLGPGPWIKPIKDRLQEMVVDGDLAPDDRERAAEIAQALFQEQA
ncbi:MAG: CCA tRNA nucleotidyltransferase [Chloroflexi bacterium]|nr:CCA tRNA nucleotidyltransferase [Chloroflexota bacterium]